MSPIFVGSEVIRRSSYQKNIFPEFNNLYNFDCVKRSSWSATTSDTLVIICKNEKKISSNYNLHMQNTRGMKAPMATKMGSMAEPSSFSYGSWALGPLGFRFFTDESLIWSDKVSSSVSLGNGGNWGQSAKKREKD